jgi:hypothetical protein
VAGGAKPPPIGAKEATAAYAAPGEIAPGGLPGRGTGVTGGAEVLGDARRAAGAGAVGAGEMGTPGSVGDGTVGGAGAWAIHTPGSTVPRSVVGGNAGDPAGARSSPASAAPNRKKERPKISSRGNARTDSSLQVGNQADAITLQG